MFLYVKLKGKKSYFEIRKSYRQSAFLSIIGWDCQSDIYVYYQVGIRPMWCQILCSSAKQIIKDGQKPGFSN